MASLNEFLFENFIGLTIGIVVYLVIFHHRSRNKRIKERRERWQKFLSDHAEDESSKPEA